MSDAGSIFRRRRRGEADPAPVPGREQEPPPQREDPYRASMDARYMMPSAPSRRIPDLPPMAPMGHGVGHVLPSSATAAGPDESKLTVGRNIRLKGEITSCDILVVEGEVEAAVACRVLEVARGGVFKGNAEVETAEISGVVDGDLLAKKVLRVLAGGRVQGRIRYGTIEVASGGQLGGDIGTLPADPRVKTAGAAA